MSKEQWAKLVDKLNKDFPLLHPAIKEGAVADYPQLSQTLDDGVDDLLRDSHLSLQGTANPLYVEDLLQDCSTRVSNCLVLRDKAHDVEARAISEALYCSSQESLIKLHGQINDLLDEVAPRSAQYATRAAIANDVATFVGDPEIWKNVHQLRGAAKSKMLEVIEAQKTKASTEGNGSNFVERFAFLKRFFDISIEETYRRSLVAAAALKTIYGIDAPVPKIRASGYLNELAVWVQKASDALDRELDLRYTGRVAFALAGVDDNLKGHELVTRARFKAMLPTGSFTFSLNSGQFEAAGMKDPLLRSIQIQIEAIDVTRSRIWPATLKLPESSVTQRRETFATVATSTFQLPVELDSTVHGVHNISPIGDWELRVPDRAITGEATNEANVKNVYLFVTVSYRRL